MPGHVAPMAIAHIRTAVEVPPPKLLVHHGMQGQLLAAMEFSNSTTATLEAEFPHSVRHFLLIGCLAMFLGAVVFGFMAFRSNHKTPETLTFIIATIATGSYYMMYSGYGVAHKETGDGKVVLIFLGRYIDWLLTTPLLLLDIALLVNADVGEITMLLGNDILMILAGTIGATLLNPYKWYWWVIGMIFFALVFIQLFGFLSKIKDDDGAFVQGIKVLVMVTFISWCIYPVLWILGSEGLGSISLDLEVGLVCLTDIVSKLGFGFYLLFAVVDTKPGQQAESTENERTSLV